jgi:hypothetical protein
MNPIIVVSLFLVFPQQPQSTVTAPRGSIEGLVLQAGSNDPIAGARVTISRVQTTPPPIGAPVAPIPAVNTDSQGKFVLKDVEPGQYRLQVAKNGYARAEYGEPIVGAQGRPLAVALDEAVKGVVIHLTPGGNVSGRVRDLSGQPVVGVPVMLMKIAYNPSGQKTYTSGGSTRTNDRGEYRLYWVTPGRYYLNTGSTQGAPVNIGGGGASPNEVQDVYTSTYYPNVTDISYATVLNVQSGAELSGIDLSITRQQLYKVRGRVIDSRTDRPPQNASFSFSSRSLTGGGFVMSGLSNTKYNNTDGSFEMRDVAPGTYGIGVTVPDPANPSPSSLIAQPNQPRAQAAVNVVSGDVENVTLIVTPPVSLPGRFSVEGLSLAAVPTLDRVRVQLAQSMDTTAFLPNASSSTSAVSTEGTLKIDNLLPGDYRVTVSNMPAGYFLKSVRLDQSDGMDQLLHVTASPLGQLEVVLSPNGGQIEGTVLNDKQQPLNGIQVVLIPEQRRTRFDLYSTSRSDQAGRFSMKGIPPGDYKIFAWEAIEPFVYYDSEFMRVNEARGKLVHVSESSTQNLEIRSVPPTEQ